MITSFIRLQLVSIPDLKSHLAPMKEDYLCIYLYMCPHQPLYTIISWHSDSAQKHQGLSTNIITIMGFHF